MIPIRAAIRQRQIDEFKKDIADHKSRADVTCMYFRKLQTKYYQQTAKLTLARQNNDRRLILRTTYAIKKSQKAIETISNKLDNDYKIIERIEEKLRVFEDE